MIRDCDRVSLIDRYAASMSDVPLLTQEQEISLSEAYQRDGDQAALDSLIRSNVRLVITIAMQMGGSSQVPVEDLIQAGCLGLSIGARRYRAGRGAKFSTYVAFWIKSEMRKCLRQGQMVSLPPNRSDGYRMASAFIEKFRSANGREPSFDEIRGVLPGSVYSQTILKALGVDMTSLDRETPDGNGRYIDLFSADVGDTGIGSDDVQEALEGMGVCLTERERTVLRMRFGLFGTPVETLPGIAKAVGCTKQNVCEIQKRALCKLRKYLERDVSVH